VKRAARRVCRIGTRAAVTGTGPGTFPGLNAPPFGGEDFQTNLIMPGPTIFLDRRLPVCPIIRPTDTNGAAMGVVKFLTDMGLFIGQPPSFSLCCAGWQKRPTQRATGHRPHRRAGDQRRAGRSEPIDPLRAGLCSAAC
jgi:hypothetical protein